MPRVSKKLTSREVAALKADGRHSDGDGLYLSIKGDRRRWVFLYRFKGKRHELGLGPDTVSLTQIRILANKAREQIRLGVNPIEARRTTARTVPTFAEHADNVIQRRNGSWRHPKTRASWANTLGLNHCRKLQSMPIDTITKNDVFAVLQPLWDTKPETAKRLRVRLEHLFRAAIQEGHLTTNPAAWDGLSALLPKPKTLVRGHMKAMAYADVPAFVARLRERACMSSLALEFLILSCARTDEVLSMTWKEIDFERAIWTRPRESMKSFEEHKQPLSRRALDILDEVGRFTNQDPDGFVFVGRRRLGKMPHLADSAMLELMKRLGIKDATPHGFRSSFADWAFERTQFRIELVEMSLSHQVGNKVARAYRRTDGLKERKPLLDAWASFVSGETASNVVELRRAK